MTERDPLIDAFVSTMMDGAYVTPAGAADYERVAGAFGAILCELIAPQPAEVCQKMQDDFARDLRQRIREARMPRLRVVGDDAP